MPFTNVRRVLLITTQIPSFAFGKNVYHYPPLVILAESLPWLYFKYKESLEAEPDTAWQEMGYPYRFLNFCVLSNRKSLPPAMQYQFRLSWRLSFHASTRGNVPVMLV